MSDNIKLVIEIPKETYLEIKEGLITRNAMASAEIIQNGIPLDDVKAEIEEKISHYNHFQGSNTAHGLEIALEIIDKHIEGVNNK